MQQSGAFFLPYYTYNIPMQNQAKKKLNKDEVLRIADLAKLTLSIEEVKKFQEQLSSTLSYIDILKNVDTSKVTVTPAVTGLENVFREDKVTQSLSQEKVLANAPKTYIGFFVIDAIFEV